METASWISPALASSRSALPPSDHVLPAPDLSTAGLGVSRARACVTQTSPGVPRPHSASLPLLCIGDSCLAAFPMHDSGPWGGDFGTPPPRKTSRTRNQILKTSSEGLPLRRQETRRPFSLAIAKVIGDTSSIPQLTELPPACLREPSAPAHQPTGSFGRTYRGNETVKIVFLFISSRGFFDSEQAGTPLKAWPHGD